MEIHGLSLQRAISKGFNSVRGNVSTLLTPIIIHSGTSRKEPSKESLLNLETQNYFWWLQIHEYYLKVTWAGLSTIFIGFCP